MISSISCDLRALCTQVNVQNVEELNEGKFLCLQASKQAIGRRDVKRLKKELFRPGPLGKPTWQQFFRASIHSCIDSARILTGCQKLPPLTLAPTGDLQQTSSLIV
ncbi:hypothetical protein T4A_9562 [Trichinella pseudospiralis]|uniref:Uncharacterized protein n=1 Tax=Trichinella pseudospiralis TaxID=6337 RepID=A0A0V0XX42_TRIPS|nr:hypothetical protein T4E_4369 [Trichinella pseudospiralis]KRY75844.1 hypothetical protein T4A_9562 [Trichinella pseudospiralis]